MNPLLYFNNDPVKILNIFTSDIAKYFLEVTIIKIYEQNKKYCFYSTKFGSCYHFRGGGGVGASLQSYRDMKCFMKSFNSPKTALETKSASKNRAEKDYEVVDLNVTENTETTKNVPA